MACNRHLASGPVGRKSFSDMLSPRDSRPTNNTMLPVTVPWHHSMVMAHCSPLALAPSSVTARSSKNTATASAKSAPCLRKLDPRVVSSYSKRMASNVCTLNARVIATRRSAGRRFRTLDEERRSPILWRRAKAAATFGCFFERMQANQCDVDRARSASGKI